MTKYKNILVAPLNWGLGHATRCIPIIKALQKNGYTPIIASDGAALELLKKEFPLLEFILLPSYNITYAKNGRFFKWKLFINTPKILSAVVQEKKQIADIIKQKNISGIISDNRLGVRHSKIPSVYLTHQVNVLSGNSSWLTSKLHQHIIKQFNECWVPDINENSNYSGELGHVTLPKIKTKLIGLLSRFNKTNTPIKHDYLVLLSGPEPQRSLLETKLKEEFIHSNKKIVFVSGVIENKQKTYSKNNCTYYNFMTSTQLEKTINESAVIISRSGYTTIMDLAHLGKKAFFIPTPGQFEQLYLAKRMDKLNYAPFCFQKDFSIDKLEQASTYNGFPNNNATVEFNELFTIFCE